MQEQNTPRFIETASAELKTGEQWFDPANSPFGDVRQTETVNFQHPNDPSQQVSFLIRKRDASLLDVGGDVIASIAKLAELKDLIEGEKEALTPEQIADFFDDNQNAAISKDIETYQRELLSVYIIHPKMTPSQILEHLPMSWRKTLADRIDGIPTEN